jgi:LacI family transcriptional regulator
MSPAKRIIVTFRIPEALRDVLEGITDFAKRGGHNWQVLCVDPDEFERTLSHHRADGAITVVPPRARRLIGRLAGNRIPVVNMLYDLTPRIASVLSDDEAIGHAGARYLVERGFRSTAFVGVDAIWSRSRQNGFASAILEAGLSAPLVAKSSAVEDLRFLSKVAGVNALRRWLRGVQKPVAVMGASDFVARALMSACHAEKLEVPRQVAILGVDNFPTICELSPVPISSVAQDFVRMAYEAAKLLALLMEKTKRTIPSAVLVSPGRIHVRQSTDIFAFEDESVIAALHLIHEHAAVGISMKQLMREVPLSRKWLDIRFKKVVGHTPSQEIRRCRMEYVRNLLIETDMPLNQIASRCQFSCPENLIRCFRVAYESPPHAYRLMHRAPKN